MTIRTVTTYFYKVPVYGFYRLCSQFFFIKITFIVLGKCLGSGVRPENRKVLCTPGL